MPTSRTDSPDELDLRIVDCLVNGLPNAAIAKVVETAEHSTKKSEAFDR